jgi:hypothetical protein
VEVKEKKEIIKQIKKGKKKIIKQINQKELNSLLEKLPEKKTVLIIEEDDDEPTIINKVVIQQELEINKKSHYILLKDLNNI